jgi:ankyrin repeat protein
MKKAIYFYALMCVFWTLLLIITVSCKSAPPAESGIWPLLANGDSRAKGYFLGEVDVNATDSKGRTPLHYVAEQGDAQLAAFFISMGANVNALDFSKQSPLSLSLEKGNYKIAELLSAAGADIHKPIYNDNFTAAKLALEKTRNNNDSPALKSLLTQSSVESTDSEGRTILHLASIEGNFQAVNDILAKTPSSSNINKNDNRGKNALDYSLARLDSKNHMKSAERLILSGAHSNEQVYNYFSPAARSANYNIRHSDGIALFHYATANNSLGLISFLFEKNADVNIKSVSGASPLHEAARAGNIAVMRMLLEKGANVNLTDAKGNTALHTGIPPNVHREAVNLLLENGADPNLRDEHGDTPLHIVIILNRSSDIIQTLLGGGSDVHIRNMQGKTPLYIAIEERRASLIPLLLSYGSDIFAADISDVTPFDLSVKTDNNIFNLLVTTETVNQRDSAGNSMLHIAVRNRGNPEHIGRILDNRAPVDARNRDGDTALHIAVRLNQKENGEFLISRGASIFSANAAAESPLYLALASSGGIREWMINPTTIIAKDGLGNNMLHYAAQWKLNSAIPVIINNGVSVESANATGETPLFMAVKTNSPSTIITLLNNRAKLNVRDNQGNTLLHAAVRWNAKDSASTLISRGIDINAHSANGNTPLHDAVAIGGDIEQLLITQGANLEVRNIEGNTPFMEAARAGFISSIERLALSGADTTTRNIKGDTPLHLAVAAERYDLVNLLLRSGASIHARNTSAMTPFRISLGISPRMVSGLLTKDRINVPDDMGSSALHIALQEKAPPEIIRAIINQGSRVNTVDSNGKTPLRLAVDTGQFISAKLLADAGADPFLTAVDNKSPADISFSRGEDCVRALFSGRAINAKDSSSNTILHLAARYGTPDIIEVLLELGANKTLRNISSEVPVDIALRWNKGENAELLR